MKIRTEHREDQPKPPQAPDDDEADEDEEAPDTMALKPNYENKAIQNTHDQPSPLGLSHTHVYRWRIKHSGSEDLMRGCDCGAEIPNAE